MNTHKKEIAQSRNLFFLGPLLTMVGMTGFEPATSRSRTVRSTNLSYIPSIALFAYPRTFAFPVTPSSALLAV